MYTAIQLFIYTFLLFLPLGGCGRAVRRAVGVPAGRQRARRVPAGAGGGARGARGAHARAAGAAAQPRPRPLLQLQRLAALQRIHLQHLVSIIYTCPLTNL